MVGIFKLFTWKFVFLPVHRLSLSLCEVQCKIGSSIAGNALQATTHHLPGKARHPHLRRPVFPPHSALAVSFALVLPLAPSCGPCLLISKSFECYYSVIYSTPTPCPKPLPLLSVCTHVHKCSANIHTHADTNTLAGADTQTHIDTEPLALFAFCSHVRTYVRTPGFLSLPPGHAHKHRLRDRKKGRRGGGRRM